MDWFLYDNGLRYERVKLQILWYAINHYTFQKRMTVYNWRNLLER